MFFLWLKKNDRLIIIRNVLLKVVMGRWVLCMMCEYLFGWLVVSMMVCYGLILVVIIMISNGKMICILNMVIRMFQVRKCCC